MKINCNFSAQILATHVNYSKDGKPFYNATVFIPSNGEAGQLNISENIFNELESGSAYDFKAEYNDKYNSFRVVGLNNE